MTTDRKSHHPRTARMEWRTTPARKAQALALADGRPLSVLLDRLVDEADREALFGRIGMAQEYGAIRKASK